MSVSVTFDTSGFRKWTGGLPPIFERALGNTISRMTALIERGGKLRAPVDTSRLRNSIASTRSMDEGEVRTHVHYAVYVHDGTRYMNPRPFLYDAATDAEGDLDAILDEELRAVE